MSKRIAKWLVVIGGIWALLFFPGLLFGETNPLWATAFTAVYTLVMLFFLALAEYHGFETVEGGALDGLKLLVASVPFGFLIGLGCKWVADHYLGR